MFNILNFIYKKKCVVCSCSKTDDLLCKTCSKDISFLSAFCNRVYFETEIYSSCIYEGTVKKLIQLLKFSHKKKCAVVLAKVLFEYYKKLNLNKNFIIIYPPAYFLKSASRGYNPIKLISEEFSKLSGFRVENNLIKKIKYTKPQYKAKNRKNNIKNSFSVDKNILKKYDLNNTNFLLLDDITTSGATIEELINLLKLNEIKNLTVLTVSKAFKK